MTKAGVHTTAATHKGEKTHLVDVFPLRPNYLRKAGTIPIELASLSLFPWLLESIMVAYLLFRFYTLGHLYCHTESLDSTHLDMEYLNMACVNKRFLTRGDNETDFGLYEKTADVDILQVGNSWYAILGMMLGAGLCALPALIFNSLEVERRLYEVAGILERIPMQTDDRRFRTFHEASTMLQLLMQKKGKWFYIKYLLTKHSLCLIVPFYNFVMNSITGNRWGGLFTFANPWLFKVFPAKALCAYRINLEAGGDQVNIGEAVATCDMPLNPALATCLYLDRFFTSLGLLIGVMLLLKDILLVASSYLMKQPGRITTIGLRRRETTFQRYCSAHPVWDNFFLDRFSTYVQPDVFEDVVGELMIREGPLRK